MFTKRSIRKLEEKGYVILTKDDAKEYKQLGRNYKKLVDDYNDLLVDFASKSSIKDLKEELREIGVSDIPKTKPELIQIYVDTFRA